MTVLSLFFSLVQESGRQAVYGTLRSEKFTYKGWIVNNQKHGKGRVDYADGTSYEGVLHHLALCSDVVLQASG